VQPGGEAVIPGSNVVAHFRSEIADFFRLAVVNEDVVGMSISVLYEETWTVAPICYLEDLFIQTNPRGGGLGRLLIQEI